jgi:hypothetical protein
MHHRLSTAISVVLIGGARCRERRPRVAFQRGMGSVAVWGRVIQPRSGEQAGSPEFLVARKRSVSHGSSPRNKPPAPGHHVLRRDLGSAKLSVISSQAQEKAQ